MRRRLSPSPRRRLAAARSSNAVNAVEAAREMVGQLLDTLFELALADPDVEQEFMKMVELQFERLKLPPPPLDLGDDIDTIIQTVKRHLEEYRRQVIGYVTSEADADEKLTMMSMNILGNAARTVVSWYAPQRLDAVQLYPEALQREARPAQARSGGAQQ